MLPVWLTGVVAYRLSSRRDLLGAVDGLILFVSSALALVALVLWQHYRAIICNTECLLLAAYARPLSDWREYAADYGIGLLVACNFIGFYFSARFWTVLMETIRRPIKWVAGATFTIYLLHYPVAKFVIAMSPWELGSWQQRALVYGATLTSVFVVAQFTERRKGDWRAAIQHLIATVRPAT
jgi:peptidoglycan/LPS O-acetylase OafA/YrhL